MTRQSTKTGGKVGPAGAAATDGLFRSQVEVPIEFEADLEEKMEALATMGRGPLRLAASALLKMDARTARMRKDRRRRETAARPTEFVDESVAAPAPPASSPPAPRRSGSQTRPGSVKASRPTVAKRVADGWAAAESVAAESVAARPVAAGPVAAERVAAKRVESKRVESKRVESKRVESKRVESKTATSKTATSKTVASKPGRSQSPARSASHRPAPSRSASHRPAASRAAAPRAASALPAASGSARTRKPQASEAIPTVAGLKKARREHVAKLAESTKARGLDQINEEAWASWEESTDEHVLIEALAQLDREKRGAGPGIRRRMGSALDRWAARETGQWEKAEKRFLPGPRQPQA